MRFEDLNLGDTPPAPPTLTIVERNVDIGILGL